MPRVGIIAWIQESNTFLPEPTTLAHYEQDVLLTGSAMREFFIDAQHEVGGMLRTLATADVETVPIFAARAIPFGAMTAETHLTLRTRLLDALLEAGPLDGVLVTPHGATVSAAVPDVDGDWLQAVRDQVGPDVPLIGTLDPHGNLSPAMVAATDALFAYRTNPHIDQAARGMEAAELMLATLAGRVRPVQAAVFPPMAMNIERQCTSEEPLAGLCRYADGLRERAGILGVSVFLGFPYADVTEMGSAALIVTDDHRELAQSTAQELGRRLWEHREGLAGTFLSVADSVNQAAAAPAPVCLLDMGDNVGGGSPADATWLLHELARQHVTPCLIILFDPESVQQAEAAGVGQRVTLSVGGRSGDLHGPPFTAEFSVQFLGDGQFTEPEARHGGFTHFDQGRTAIVQTDDGITVMLTSRRVPPFSLRQLTSFGLDPAKFRVMVAKGVNAPLAAYAPVCPTVLRVNTPGVTTADMTTLPYHHRRRPMYPFERDAVWS